MSKQWIRWWILTLTILLPVAAIAVHSSTAGSMTVLVFALVAIWGPIFYAIRSGRQEKRVWITTSSLLLFLGLFNLLWMSASQPIWSLRLLVACITLGMTLLILLGPKVFRGN